MSRDYSRPAPPRRPRPRDLFWKRWPAEATEREQRLLEQRRSLPDGPGVYLFRDAEGEVLYVGKARSLRKRVANHFSNPVTRGAVEIVSSAADIEFLLLSSDAEALLAENRLIKRHQPRFNIRLRDDKSYPYIAISMDEDFPRVYFTRERHRSNRTYFGPYSNAKRTRATLDVLSKVFLIRSCQGTEPGRRSGSPCLDFHINRCGAPCVGYVTREQYSEAIDGVVAFLSGRYKEIERDIEQRMNAAAEAQEYEQAALERNRLRAVRSLLERQRVANDAVGSLDTIAVAVDGTDANAQVFQVRDGVLADRQSFYLENPGELELGEVAVEFIAQYYEGRPGIPPQIIVQGEVDEDERATISAALAERRGAGVEVRAAERGDKRRILELAERNALLALDQERLKAERTPPAARRGARRAAARAVARRAAAAHRVLRHLEPDGHAHRRLDGRLRGRRAEEERLPALHDPLAGGGRAGRLRGDARGADAAAAPTGRASATSLRTTRRSTSRSPRCPT